MGFINDWLSMAEEEWQIRLETSGCRLGNWEMSNSVASWTFRQWRSTVHVQEKLITFTCFFSGFWSMPFQKLSVYLEKKEKTSAVMRRRSLSKLLHSIHYLCMVTEWFSGSDAAECYCTGGHISSFLWERRCRGQHATGHYITSNLLNSHSHPVGGA